MKEQQLIPAATLCLHYNIEISFVNALNELGLIQVHIVEQTICIHPDEVPHFERIVRLHNDLNVNLEGIDVVLNLLEKERQLREELTAVKNRLRLYENI